MTAPVEPVVAGPGPCDRSAARPSADTETLFERVRRLVMDHGIRDDENGELFADRLDDVLHAALDGKR